MKTVEQMATEERRMTSIEDKLQSIKPPATTN